MRINNILSYPCVDLDLRQIIEREFFFIPYIIKFALLRIVVPLLLDPLLKDLCWYLFIFLFVNILYLSFFYSHSGYESGGIRIWEFHSTDDFQEEPTIKYKAHQQPVKYLLYNTDGSTLASACVDKVVVKQCRENVSYVLRTG